MHLRQTPPTEIMRIEDLPTNRIIRKRKYRLGMSDESLESSRLELLEMEKKTQDISPLTAQYLEKMIDVCETLQCLEKTDPEYPATKTSMRDFEAVLDSRLAKDEKYRAALLEFREMETRALLLRYGDYLGANCQVLGAKSRDRAKGKNFHDELRGMRWQVVAKQLEEEMRLDSNWDPMQGDPRPDRPMSKIIEPLADLCNMTFEDAVFSIQFYAKRCVTAHNGIDDFADAGDLGTLAHIIVRDEEAIRNGVMVGEVAAHASELLSALEIYKGRYFDKVETKMSEEDIRVVKWYKPSAEFEASEAKKEKEKLEAETMALNLEKIQTTAQRARDTSSTDRGIMAAREEFLSALEDRDRIQVELKKLSKEMGTAEKRLTKGLAEFEKLVPSKNSSRL